MKSLVVLALVAGVADARAGTYTQYACRVNGAPARADGVTVVGSGVTSAGGACETGGGLYGTLNPRVGGARVDVVYDPPADTSLAAAGVTRTFSDVGTWSGASYEFHGTYDQCPGQTCDQPVLSYGWGEPLPGLTVSLSCPSAGCSASAVPRLQVDALWFRLRDDILPSVNRVTGFLAGGTISGLAEASFEATDRGGGVYMQELVIDDVGQGKTVVDDNGGSCQTPFVARVPCKLAALGEVAFDTTKVRDGDHTVALRVYDATLDNFTTYGPVAVHVDNSVPASAPSPSGGGSAPTPSSAPAPAPSPAAAQTPTTTPAPPSTPQAPGASPPVQASSVPLGIRVVPRRSDRVVRQVFGRRSTLQGRLLDTAGNPIAATEVGTYVTLERPNARPTLVATAVTGPDGSYRLTLPPGPNRRITIRPTTRDADAWTFRVQVAAPIVLTPDREHLRNGQTLMLTASITGARIPARSADVAFQVLIGTQWRTFATRTLGANGVAQVRHTFRVTYQRMTYRFRAITLKRRAFPFENARSRVVSVRLN